MTDPQAEQDMELEALQAILMDDLQEVIDSVPSGWKPEGKVWRVVLAPQQEAAEETEYPLRLELVFAHTPSYPDDAPLLKARGLQGLSDADVAVVQGVLEEQVEANLGMAMIYTLIGAAQEWIEDKAAAVAAPSLSPEEEERRRREAEEERLAELRRHGTAVTREAFAEWRARFNAEQRLSTVKLRPDGGTGGAAVGKLTGKQWFLQQEAQHLEVEEPELLEDEADGEDERSNWSEGEGEEELDFEEEESEEDEDLLNRLEASIAAKGGGS